MAVSTQRPRRLKPTSKTQKDNLQGVYEASSTKNRQSRSELKWTLRIISGARSAGDPEMR